MTASELIEKLREEIRKRGYDPELIVDATIECPWGSSVGDTLGISELVFVDGRIGIVAC
jgi:hypothetical protein